MSKSTQTPERLFIKGDDWLIEGHEAFAKQLLDSEGSGKAPNVLYVPTAKSSPERLEAGFRQVAEVFGKLGVGQVVQLHQYREAPSRDEAEHKFGEADIVYIGGGDSLEMMENFKKWGTDTDLKNAIKGGKRVGGASAGQIALMGPGFSDSMSYRNPANEWDYIWVNGMKILNIANTPHLNSGIRDDASNLPPRKQAFLNAYARDSDLEHPQLPDKALGVSNGAMVMIDGDQAEISTVAPGGISAFRRESGNMHEQIFGGNPASGSGQIVTRADLGIAAAA